MPMMLRSGCALLFSVLAATATIAAQRVPALPPVYGTVTGRITCVDTNQPARLASVTLQTIDVKPESTEPPSINTPPPKMMHTYQTSLDGTFTIPKVVPGTYYVIIQHPGYVSPITQFARIELQQPTPEILAKILRAVPTITVEANQTANIETRIERGGELSGTIRYDDGTPVGATSVNVLSKETKEGKDTWVSNHNGSQTDDLGRYRITGLPAGEYLLEVYLSMSDVYRSSVIGDSGNMMMMTRYHIAFYTGDVTRKDKSKPAKLKVGEQRDGADITIPLSKLHRVSGTLTEGRSGHVVNGGDVALQYADGTELAKTKVDPEDNNTFHFDYVPEGDYVLVVTSARDVIREEDKMLPNNVMPMPGQPVETFVRGYADTKQPLTIQSEMSGVTIPVQAQSHKPPAIQ